MRIAALSALSLALVGAACAGPEGRQAQALLEQAQSAGLAVQSASFEIRISVSMEGQQLAFVMNGGGYLKGARAGDQVLSLRGEGLPGLPNAQIVQRGGRIFMNANGSWRQISAATSTAQAETFCALLTRELTRHVKDVRVLEGDRFRGEPVTKVYGVVDTARLLSAVSEASGMAGLRAPAPEASELDKYLGDIKAVLFISDRSHLLRAAVMTMSIEAEGQTAELRVVYRLTGVNRPIAIPAVG